MVILSERLQTIGGICILELIAIWIYDIIAKALGPGIVLYGIAILAYILPSILLSIFKPTCWGLGVCINLFFGWTIIGYAIAMELVLQAPAFDATYEYEEYSKTYSAYLPKMKVFLKDYGEYDHYLLSYVRWYSYETDPQAQKYSTRSTTSSFAEQVRTDALKHMSDPKCKELYRELTWLYKNNRSAFKSVASFAYSELGKKYEDPTYKYSPCHYYPSSTATIKDQYGNTYDVYRR